MVRRENEGKTSGKEDIVVGSGAVGLGKWDSHQGGGVEAGKELPQSWRRADGELRRQEGAASFARLRLPW